ncbi:MAG: hypothetical protein JNN06_01330 [Gemmobacter sp.]|nr:hypothetical protein [Gemmobacter sp.]
MASVLAEVFGSEVVYTPSGGVPRSVQSIFREQPIEVQDQDGHPVLITAPTWRVRKDLVPEVARGDRIAPGNGKTYAIHNVTPSGSAAADANVICELERVFE